MYVLYISVQYRDKGLYVYIHGFTYTYKDLLETRKYRPDGYDPASYSEGPRFSSRPGDRL
jgi:hypothetical protein